MRARFLLFLCSLSPRLRNYLGSSNWGNSDSRPPLFEIGVPILWTFPFFAIRLKILIQTEHHIEATGEE